VNRTWAYPARQCPVSCSSWPPGVPQLCDLLRAEVRSCAGDLLSRALNCLYMQQTRQHDTKGTGGGL